MNNPFQGSRLANLRQKRPSQFQNVISQKQQQKPLALQLQQQTAYQPSMAVQANRTATRFLKGRIQRTSGTQKTNLGDVQSQGFVNKQNSNVQRKPTLKLSQPQDGDLKLVLNDSPQFDKKKLQIKVAPQQPAQKRILIQKKEQQPKPQIKQQIKQQVKPQIKQPVNKVQQQVISAKNNQQPLIQQEQVEQSKDGLQNQNQLIQCPQGCGRKFNKKALEKHAKACKLVFMSKRKQFNSEAKRLTSQQQAALIKQNKLHQKKAQMGMTKGKGFEKTGQNWKAASQDFRSALKAIKKQGVGNQGQGQQKQQLKVATCQYCQKQFADVLLAKHQQNCVKKKQKQQKQKKKTTKKK